MSAKNDTSSKARFPILAVLIAILALGVIGSVSGFAFAAGQEQHDSFCASCHTQPESTFYQRSTASLSSDMASFHTSQKVNCIDCHSGVGTSGRIQAELMGAHNALLWYTGTAKQPAVLTTPINDQNCLKCHQDVVQRRFSPKEQIAIPGGESGGEREGRNGHWHQFLARWQAASTSAGTCTSCHGGHLTGVAAQSGFMSDPQVLVQCDDCHKAIRRED